MTEITSYVFEFMEEFVIIFSGDVQTTTIALAITSSLCCTLFWFVVSLASGASPQPARSKKNVPCISSNVFQPSHVVSSFHIRRGITDETNIPKHTRGKTPDSESVWSTREVEKNCNIPCIRCGYHNADRYCRMLRCRNCCNNCIYGDHKKTLSFVANKPDEKSARAAFSLDMSFQRLVQCPDRVGFLGRNLVTLNLSNNHLLELPEEICCLTGLQELFLHHNSLSTIPANLGGLSCLEELDIRHNRLTEVPDTIRQLVKLHVLNLGHNRIQYLSPAIGDLTCLENFSINHNKLKYIPEEVCLLQKLKKLSVASNPLCALPSPVSQLMLLCELDVSSCNLHFLPESLSQCSHMIRISANSNRLVRLPCHLGHLHQLRELHVQHNKLSFVPASLASSQLYILSIDGNKMDVNPEMFKNTELEEGNLTLREPCSMRDGSAAVLIQLSVPWQDHNLPQELQDMLSGVKHCFACGQPLFDLFRMKKSMQIISGFSQPLPLVQFICPSKKSPSCQFINYVM